MFLNGLEVRPPSLYSENDSLVIFVTEPKMGKAKTRENRRGKVCHSINTECMFVRRLYLPHLN